MLKLGFRKGEKVFIDVPGKERIEIIINGYTKCRYSLLFNAPKEVRIIRESAKNQDPNILTEESDEAGI